MANITFNLESSIIKFIKTYSNKHSISQKEFVELAIKKIRQEEMRKKIREESMQFWQNNKDEFISISEGGIEDYNNTLNKLENAK